MPRPELCATLRAPVSDEKASLLQTLRRPFRRTPTTVASIAFALIVGGLSAWAEQRTNSATGSAPRVALLVFAYASACSAFTLALSLVRVGRDSVLPSHFRAGAAGVLVLAWTLLDLACFRVLHRHIDAEAIHLGYEAVKSGTLHVGATDVAAALAALVVALVGLALAHAQLSRWGQSPHAEHLGRAAAAVVIVVGLASALLHERLWDERHAEAARLEHALPWAPSLAQSRFDNGKLGFGGVLDQLVASELEQRRRALESAQLSAKQKPDLLIVHVESLRADMLTLMPRLSELAHLCVASPRHYATGNNTGSAVFGLVSGLSAYQYPFAREKPAPALPLLVLHKMGYRNAVHLANNLADYDDIYNVVFQGAIDEKYTAPDAASDQMDQDVIAHYLGSLGKTPGPRFDYLVLDSTHYDYSYPPEYERFTPSATMGLGIRDGFIESAEAVARARERAPLVKNRYKNSVLWMDSLIARLVDGMKAAEHWNGTWVAIVGDHGEAFFEHDTFGHGSGLDEEQIHVPLVLCGLGQPQFRGERSSHADVFPTWFERMGLSGAPGPFMNGRSLFAPGSASDVVSVGMGITGKFFSHRFVAIGSGKKVSFDNIGQLPVAHVSDLDDQPLPESEDAERVLAGALNGKLLRSP
jgi:membrane-anchored protein YejM (alkaline phosphatase superfamily)